MRQRSQKEMNKDDSHLQQYQTEIQKKPPSATDIISCFFPVCLACPVIVTTIAFAIYKLYGGGGRDTG